MDNPHRMYVEEGEELIQSPNLTTLTSVMAAAVIILALCWYFCKRSHDQEGEDTEEKKSLVIAREAKPGYLIIQGNNNEEIFRIIKEYESAREGGQPVGRGDRPQDVYPEHTLPIQNYDQGYGGRGASAPLELARPPPYAPFNMYAASH